MKKIDRRKFLKKVSVGFAGAVVGFPYVISSSALGKDGSISPSNRITLGFIGVGNWGSYNLEEFLGESDAQIVAVCDVKRNKREAAQKRVDSHYAKKVCAAYNDFRELMGRDDIDAVVIATQDHWHVLQALCAARAGKDVFLEKPMGVSIKQCKVLRDVIQRYKRVFQFGTELRSTRSCRFACELVRNGRIGKLHTIKVGAASGLSSGNYPPMPVPDWLDYELWLGPATWKPYTENRVINRYWQNISDYSLGWVSSWGIHLIDIAQWGNNADDTGPVEIEGTGVYPKDGMCDCATGWNVDMTYANGVKLNYTDCAHPDSPLENKASYIKKGKNRHGVRFEGDQGWVFACFNELDAHPKSLLKSVIGPNEVRLSVSNDHERNFLDCVKTRQQTVCPIEIAVRSDTVCNLSHIAMQLGRKLKWDPHSECFLNDRQANKMLSWPMRSPWHL